MTGRPLLVLALLAAAAAPSRAFAARDSAGAAPPGAAGGARRRFQEACASLEKGDLAAARTGFDEALSLDSRFSGAYAERAVVLSLQGLAAQASVDYHESRKTALSGASLAPAALCGPVAARILRRLSEATRLSRASRARAIVLFLKGNRTGARRKLDESLSADPGDPESYQSRAVVREASGDWRGALEDYEQGAKVGARRADFLKGLLASRDELRLRRRKEIVADEAAKAKTSVPRAAAGPATPNVPRRAAPLDLVVNGWRLLAALGLLLAARAARPPAATAGDRRPWLLFLGALALRCVFGLWGPFHHNGHGIEWVWAALERPGEFYGPGYFEVMRPFAALFSRAPDLGLFAANAAAASLLPVLVYGMARRLFDDRETAWLAGLLMLADPISVRYAATEAYLIPISVLTAAAALLLMEAVSTPEGNLPSARGAALAVAGGLLAAQATRIHPVAWLPAGLALAAAGCAWKARGVRSRGTAWLAAAGLAALLAAALPTILASFARIMQPPIHGAMPLPYLMFSRDRWWIGLLAVAGAGAALARTTGLAEPALPLALAAAAAALGTRDVYIMSRMFSAGYDRIFFPFLLPGAALLACRWPRASRAPLAAAGLGAVLLLAPYCRALFRRNTEQLEYRATRAWLAALPGDCLIASPRPFVEADVAIPDFATKDGDYVDRRHPKVSTEKELESLARENLACAYYLRTSLCTISSRSAWSPLNRSGDTCEEIERAPGLVETARATLPAHSSVDLWGYSGPTVDIVLFRLATPGG